MKLKILLVILFLLYNSVPGQLVQIGLNNKTVNSIITIENNYYEKLIIAGTENYGMYFHQINDNNTVWINTFNNNRTITALYAQEYDLLNTKLFWAVQPDTSQYNILIFSNVMPIQSAIVPEDSGLNKSKVKIIKSMAGFNYSPISSIFPPPIFCCTNDPNIYRYANRTWNKVWEGPDIVNFNFVYANNSTVWAGGIFNGFIATPFLLKSTNYGLEWDTLQLPIGEVYSCYSTCVSPINNNIVFAGLNDFILKSNDGGKTWIKSLSNIHGVIFTSLLINPGNPEQIFAGGKTLDNNFAFYESDNNGVNWHEINPTVNCNCIIKAGINTLAGITVDDKYIIYIGTAGDGVWKYSKSVSSNIKELNVPAKYYLYQNYPNPFNPSTIINYMLERNGFVTIKIYDVLGKEIKTLVNEYQNAGTHRINFDATGIASGVYFYRIVSGKYSEVKKMVLLR